MHRLKVKIESVNFLIKYKLTIDEKVYKRWHQVIYQKEGKI